MTTGISIDIWNEPDINSFWTRGQTQYLQMWGWTNHRLRTELPNVMLIGPALSGQPDASNTWWTSYLSFFRKDSSVPDQYVWHMEGGGGDMLTMNGTRQSMLKTYGLPSKPLNIDEYATYDEECPAGSSWWISQLERVNAIGLRGNWLSGNQLHDFMASLVSKPDATSNYSPTSGGYFPSGDLQVYKYYSQNMTGHRVGSLPSADLKLDTYATVGTDMVRVLTGVRISKGTWQITINNLSAVGLPASGPLSIHTWGFPFTGGHFGQVIAPNDLRMVILGTV